MRPIARECLDERSQGIGDGDAGDRHEKDRPCLVKEPQRDGADEADDEKPAYSGEGVGALLGSARKAIVEAQESVPIRPEVDRQSKKSGPRLRPWLPGGGRREGSNTSASNVDRGG